MSIEVLTPAGSLDILKVAVNNGADAVYIGGSSFSARANAVNFSDEEIAEAVSYAHIRGAKVYVALNTLVEDAKFDRAYEFSKFCYQVGVDALIVQDLGVLSMLKTCFPDFKLNASTQMTIHNLKGVKAAENAGFSRIVLSRELSKAEIAEISSKSKVEIEVFAHGALCMCYSGQCLMSSFIGGRSGNRGACAQPCRLPYSLLDGNGKIISENKYLLSLKDLCLLDEIGTLKNIGVTSLKIEGRMKNSAYVAMASHLYDKYRNGGRADKSDIDDLSSVFSRSGFTKGYFENDTGANMLNMDKNNDDVYRNITDTARERAEALANSCGSKISLNASFTAKVGEYPVLCLWDNEGNSAEIYGEIVSEKAIKVALTDEKAVEQISKTGGTAFEIGEFIPDIGDNVSLPVKEINNMRRRAIAEIEKQRTAVPRRSAPGEFSFNIVKGTTDTKFTATVSTYEQAKILEKEDIARIYVPKSVFDSHKDEFVSDRIFVILPTIERFGKESVGYGRIVTSNFSQIEDEALVKHGGFRMNIFNSPAVKYLKNIGFDSVTLSPELNMGQIRAVSKDIETEVIAYGRIPVMTVQNCLVKSACGKCTCNGGIYYLRDRMGAEFPVITDNESCTNVILNSTPIYMGDKMADIRNSGVTYANLYFTAETEEEIKNIIDLYRNGDQLGSSYTRGHFYRGV